MRLLIAAVGLGLCGAVVLALTPVALCCDLRDEGRETSKQLVRCCVFPATAVAAIFLVTAASVYMDSVITPLLNS